MYLALAYLNGSQRPELIINRIILIKDALLLDYVFPQIKF